MTPMNERRVVRTAQAPAAIGPYSQAVIAGGLVHCSGQVALDPLTGALVGAGDVEAQAEQVLRNLAAVLAAGSDLARVLKCTVFLADMNDFAKVNAVYARHFDGGEPPARATVQVSRLPKDALVEIDCVALVQEPGPAGRP
jgi:2-iminobutanoate/2-iminopropanoate deaminase